jgi:glycosyltransferase involved in cell wall biosynthesis
LNYCYESHFTHIHSATPGPVGLAALAIARILNLPCYATYHTSLPQYAGQLTGDTEMEDLTWRFMIWYYSQMDMILAPSESVVEELVEKGIKRERIRVHPRGIDLERFHPERRTDILEGRWSMNGDLRLLYVGRVSKEKNLDLLSESFRSLARTREDLALVVVGDGPYLPEMKKKLEGTRTVFTGYLEGEELAAVYASCDLFVFPSTTDTFGNVVLEAQASGLPVVVTDAGGPSENMLPEKTGLVVRANDSDALTEAVLKVVSNRERLQAMGRMAREYTEGRSFEQAFEQTWEFYEQANAISKS